MIDLRVLGTLAIHRPGEPAPLALTQPKRLALLLHLALAEPAGLKSRDTLVALLWPEADDESARHALRNALHGLRETLGDTAIVSRGNGYVGLDPAVVRCDALEVRRLLADRHWEGAVAAWHGDLAPGFNVSGAPEFERWLDDQRTSLRRAVTEAAWQRVAELERSGGAGLVAAARRAWALEPTDEAGARRLIRFLDAAVGRSAALGAYDELADYLRREYGTEPSAETRALAADLKARIEPQLSRTPAALPKPSATHTEAVALAPPARRRRVARTGVLIAAAILIAGGVSLFARHGAGSASPGIMDPVKEAEREGALRLPPKYRQDTSAYSSYLRGLTLRFTGSQAASRDTFAALLERDPLYAPALSGIAHAYTLVTIGGAMPPAEGWPKVEAAARRAIALDSASASAYLALGAVEMFWRWNLPRAGELIDKGLALDPGDPEAHAVRSTWFRWRGELDSAVAEARRSHELDPLSAFMSARTGRQLYLARRYAEAEAMYRQTIRDYPEASGPYTGLSDVYRATGRLREALAMQRMSREVDGDSAAAAQIPAVTSEVEAARVFADMASKQLSDLETGARKGDWVPPAAFAYVYAELRDPDETLRWLDSMRVGRDPSIHNVPLDPSFDFLRDDPRYRAWEAKLTWREPAAAAADTATARR
jgi:DNA-binding SARP family transcriptional activator/tetratricopeptide (TPR) repeat protein